MRSLTLPILFSLVVFCSSHAGFSETFRFRLISEPETLDWNRAQTPVETYLLMNLMEGLVTFDENLKVVPDLAQKWTLSPDRRVYTFSIRKGILWSDGVELKAQHFYDSWKRLLTPETAAAYAYFLYDVVGAEQYTQGKDKDFSHVGIKVLGDYEFQVMLKQPVAHWIEIPTFWVTFPIRLDLIQKHGKNWTRPGKLVTLGPYALKTHLLESRIELVKNSKYSSSLGPIQNVDRVIGLTVRDDATAMNLYETKQIDFLTDIASIDLKRLQNRSDLRAFPYLKTGYVGLVSTQTPLTDRHFRRALIHSIDRSRFGSILYGKQTQAFSFVPPPLLGSSESVGLRFDPSQAKEEWKQVPQELKNKKISLLISSGEKQMTVAQYLQAQIKNALGIQIEIENFDHKTFRSQLNQARYPLYLLSWSADYPDADNFLSMFLTTSGNNRVKLNSSIYNDWVLKGRHLQRSSDRKTVYEKAQRLLLEEEAVILPLYYEPNLALVSDCVKGLRLSPLNTLLLKNVTLCHR